MYRFIYLLLLPVFLITTCKTYETKNINELKKDLISYYLNKDEYDINFQKYNINKPSDLIFNDKNLYYLFAKTIYDNKENNIEWFNFLIKNAVQKDNIFRNDAVKLYFEYLYSKLNNEKAKDFIKDNMDALKTNEGEIYRAYINNKSISTIENIPSDKNLFLIVYEVLKNDPKALQLKENQDKINNYFISSKLRNDKNFKYKNELKNLIVWSKNNYFLNCIYYKLTKNRSLFTLSLNNYFKYSNETDYDVMSLLKNASKDLGDRKNFYKTLSYYYKKNKYYKYFYGIDVVYFENYRKGAQLLKESLNDFNDKSIINFNIRLLFLNSSIKFTKEWISDAVAFINDYPDNSKTKSYIYNLMRTAIVQNKTDFLLPFFKEINLAYLASDAKSSLLYYLHLIDEENKEKWKNILVEELPMSFEALQINNGLIKVKSSNNFKKLMDNKLSEEGESIYNRINYLMDFKYIDEANKIDYSYLPEIEKVKILNIFYTYHISINDYYRALRIAKQMAELFYKKNLFKITDPELLKKFYPQHFKEIIFKYSDEFSVNPALSFAVMREESNFKPSIVSHKNAIGLMQIIPVTGKFIAQKLKLSKYDLRNPEDNIRMGIYYINFLDSYFNKYEHVVSSYNAGPNRTKRWVLQFKNYSDEIAGELIPIYETRNYVKSVMRSYYIYKFLIESES